MSDPGLSDFVMPRGRPPKPEHRINHGTDQGYLWHSRQRKADPSHQTCPRCKKHWRERQSAYRQKRRSQRTILRQIILGGQKKGTFRMSAKTLNEIERVVNKLATDEQKRDLFD